MADYVEETESMYGGVGMMMREENTQREEVDSMYGDTIMTNSQEDNVQQLERFMIARQREEGLEGIRNYQMLVTQMKEAFKIYLEGDSRYEELLSQMAAEAEKKDKNLCHQRITISLNKISGMSRMITDLIEKPYISIPAFQAALRDHWEGLLSGKTKITAPTLGLTGWLGRRHVTPRGLDANMLNHLIAVDGVINKCSVVHPKLVQSVYVGEDKSNAEAERSVHTRDHWDITNLDKTLKDAQPPPANDPEGHIDTILEIGLCTYKNHQKFCLQETPETAPTGQMPRSVDVIVEDDLTDNVKCGDRVRVWGVYRVGASRADPTSTGFSKPYLIANNVQKINSDMEDYHTKLNPTDVSNILSFASRRDAFDVLAHSFAPSLCGLDEVKKGLLLMIFGGAEKALATGHHIRGDIHILLIGDPSCGKSQLLRYVMNIMPGTISASGRGSSGVGLTAAVVTDSDTGERHVEAGAMVMGDGNIVCIDEFDKMQQSDRVAIHEVLEQQTVTVAKAGIYTTLNARCSVLAAANPLYGCWSDDTDFGKQLNFPDSLMSRFDLVYVVRDACDEEGDERIASAVLHNVTTKAKPLTNSERNVQKNSCIVQPDQLILQDNNQLEKSLNKYAMNSVLEDSKIFSHRHEMVYNDKDGKEHEVLSLDFMRKYIRYARKDYYKIMSQDNGWCDYPEISDEATEEIVQYYADIRARAHAHVHTSKKKMLQSITARTLEGIVRLSTAHARLKLRRYVTKDDVERAKELLSYTLFGEPIYNVSNGSEDEEYAEEDESNLIEEDEASSVDEEYESERIDNLSAKRKKNKTEKSGKSKAVKTAVLSTSMATARKRTRGRKELQVGKEADKSCVLQNKFQNLKLGEIEKTKKRRTLGGIVDESEHPEEISPRRLNILMQHVNEAFNTTETPELDVDTLLKEVNHNAQNKFTMSEFENCLQQINAMDSAPLLYDKTTGIVYPC